MEKYTYTLKVDFDAIDDIDARRILACIKNSIDYLVTPSLPKDPVFVLFGEKKEVTMAEKLQRVFPNKPPEKVNL